MKTSNRRFLGLLGTVALAGALVPGLASAQTQSKAKKDKVVFQMSDNDPAKWGLALNNMRNVQVELGEEDVDVELVAFGPGIAMLKGGSPMAQRITEALKTGAKVVACENTMKAQKLVYADMLPDIGYVPAGVVELMRKQQQGWAYIKPLTRAGHDTSAPAGAATDLHPAFVNADMINIAFNHFTPGLSLLGGLMIGLSATLLILGVGRVAGIAGIVGGTLQSLSRLSFMGQGVRIAFTAGLLLAPAVWKLVLPMPAATAAAGPALLVLAGLLVGVGVRMGNGCTSGHGVCGLSRLSLRSLANVLAFMGAGMATVYVLRHVL